MGGGGVIGKWGRLQQWLGEGREFQLWQKRLNVTREEWDRTARHPDALLRGALLGEAKRWIETRSNDLNSDEKDFIEAELFFLPQFFHKQSGLHQILFVAIQVVRACPEPPVAPVETSSAQPRISAT